MTPTRTAVALCSLLLAGCGLAEAEIAVDDTSTAASDVVEGTINNPPDAAVDVFIDVTDPSRTPILYERGFVQPMNAAVDGQTDSTLRALSAGATVSTATIDLNAPGTESQFLLQGSSLTFNPAAPDFVTTRLRTVRAIELDAGVAMKRLVQISGMPAVLSDAGWLDERFIPRDGINGNFYPLVAPRYLDDVQGAVTAWVLAKAQQPELAGATWIGTQEPSHTLGFSPLPLEDGGLPCTSIDVDRDDCRMQNINRMIRYWKPIAATLVDAGVAVGGVQLNSHDHDLYAWAAARIVDAGMPLSTFTIQRYSSSPNLMNDAQAAYDVLHRSPGYEAVKISFDRYSFDNQLSGVNDPRSIEYFTTSAGAVDFLANEAEIMDHADIMGGYSYQGAALGIPGAWLGKAIGWLQKAPTNRVPVTSTSRDVSGFALVTDNRRSSIALYNTSNVRAHQVTLSLAHGIAPGNAVVTIYRGSGTDFTEGSAVLTGTIARSTLAQTLDLPPRSFVLIDVTRP